MKALVFLLLFLAPKPIGDPTLTPTQCYFQSQRLQQNSMYTKFMTGPGGRLFVTVRGPNYKVTELLFDCLQLDKDKDEDVDLKDYALWQAG